MEKETKDEATANPVEVDAGRPADQPLRPWVVPTFERLSLSDAMAGTIGIADVGGCS